MGLWTRGVNRSKGKICSERLENVDPYDRLIRINTDFFVHYIGDCSVEIYNQDRKLKGMYMLNPTSITKESRLINTTVGCIVNTFTFGDGGHKVLFESRQFQKTVLNTINNWIKTLL